MSDFFQMVHNHRSAKHHTKEISDLEGFAEKALWNAAIEKFGGRLEISVRDIDPVNMSGASIAGRVRARRGDVDGDSHWPMVHISSGVRDSTLCAPQSFNPLRDVTAKDWRHPPCTRCLDILTQGDINFG